MHTRMPIPCRGGLQYGDRYFHCWNAQGHGSLTLEQANRIIAAILARGAEIGCRPLSAIVVEPGCVVKAFQKEDGSSMIRFEMAFGKAYTALAMGRSSKLVRVRCYLHDDTHAAQGWYANAERVIEISKPFYWS